MYDLGRYPKSMLWAQWAGENDYEVRRSGEFVWWPIGKAATLR